MPRPLCIIKTGSTLPALAAHRGDFEDWIREGMALAAEVVRVIRVAEGEPLPPAHEVSGAVVTGSSAMVTSHEPWSVRTGAWLAEAVGADLPILGICYGHQLLAEALGGHVAANPEGREIGTVAVTLTDAAASDALFGGFPRSLGVQETHQEAVLTLPPGAVHLAFGGVSEFQAFRWRRAWGVQFHPEFDAEIVRGYIEARRDAIAAEGLNPDALRAAVHDTSVGPDLLRRFAAIVTA